MLQQWRADFFSSIDMARVYDRVPTADLSQTYQRSNLLHRNWSRNKKNIRQNDASDSNDCSGQLLEVEKKIMSNESHFLLPSMPVVDAHE